MINPMPFPHKEGSFSRQAHADLPSEGIYEREISREGFSGAASHIHHKHPPTGWSQWEGPLKPRAFDLNLLDVSSPNPWDAPLILENSYCCYRVWHCNETMPNLVRNADGDDLLFVHSGSGEFFCDYGHLSISEGDYLVVPRSTAWRLEVITPLKLLMIEATNEFYGLPDKGLVGHHAIFDPSALDTPKIDERFKQQQDENEWQILVKRHRQTSTITYPFNPLDAIGWHGNETVVRINWRDIRPLMSHRDHLPPSAHTTFLTKHFIVCTFVPRPIETDPGALKVPFYHNNDDYDEVIFYHQGDFFSRDNISPGMVTFHPCGFTHGPHPKAFQAGLQATKKFTDEVAVMLDSRIALNVGDSARQVENPNYVFSWRELCL